MAQRAYKYRVYPDPEQQQLLLRTFGCTRFVWNYMLGERSRIWAQEHRSLSFAEQSRMLTELKSQAEYAWLNEVSSVALQQVLRHQQAAFSAFFAKRSRYPRFKSKHRSRRSATFSNQAASLGGRTLRLPKMGPLEVRGGRFPPADAEQGSVVVSLDTAGRWFASVQVEDRSIQPLPRLDTAVGIDAGLTSLLTLSTGRKVANPHHERRDRERLARAQRNLSQKQKDSRNREKARLRVGRAYARISDRRSDHLHKLTTRLVHENQVIAVEDLHVRGMIQNHSLARVISDASWGEMVRQLEYKSAWYGRTFVKVDRWFPSSKTCSGCGHLMSKMPLDVRSWECPSCGAKHDRDVNAAKNILSAGLAAVMPVEGA